MNAPDRYRDAAGVGLAVVLVWYLVWGVSLACAAWCSPAGVCL